MGHERQSLTKLGRTKSQDILRERKPCMYMAIFKINFNSYSLFPLRCRCYMTYTAIVPYRNQRFGPRAAILGFPFFVESLHHLSHAVQYPAFPLWCLIISVPIS